MGGPVRRAGAHVERAHVSEDALAALALERASRRRAILVGGLGLGYTLRAALDRARPEARLLVAEVVPDPSPWRPAPT